MVTEAQVWEALAEIPDPEIPVISLVDLGVVRGVEDSNLDARRLYDRLGYRTVNVGDFQYTGAPTPNPGVWMRKDIAC